MQYIPEQYQVDAIKWLLSHKYAGLFLPPGLGKTGITLKTIDILKTKRVIDFVIIIAPLRVTRLVWQKENDKWDFNFNVTVLHGNDKLAKIKTKQDIYLINPAGLPWFIDSMHLLPKGKMMLVCDESTIFKNSTSNVFKSFKKVLPRFDRRVILTGTPAPNGLMQVWGQIYMLDMGERLNKFITHFRSRYFYRPNSYNPYAYELLPGADEKIYEKINDIVMHKSKDEIELPPLMFNYISVELPESARSVYKAIKKDSIANIDEDTTIVARNAGVRTFKLQQIANGCVFDDNNNVIKIHSAKIDALVELANDCATPVLVVYEYTHDLGQLLKAFPGVPYIGASDDSKLVDEWNASKVPLMLMQLRRGSHGLNLQESTCTDVVFFSIPFDLELYEQAYQRVWRRGLKNGVVVHHIVAENTIDELIAFEVLQNKMTLQNALLKAMEK